MSGTTTTITWEQQNLVLESSIPVDPLNPQQLLTPSIAPAIDGFFLSWSEPYPNQAVRIGLEQFRGSTVLTANYYSEALLKAQTTATMCVFPSVTSRDETALNPNFERLHVAWEEDIPGGQSYIYYTRFEHTIGSTDIFTQAIGNERVSVNTCWNHHPNIAIENLWSQGTHGPQVPFEYEEPDVTWEQSLEEIHCTGNGPNSFWVTYKTSVAMRSRYNDANGWSSITSFYPEENNLPLPLIRHEGIPMIPTDPPPGWKPGGAMHDVEDIVFQDQAAGQIHFRKFMTTFNPDPAASQWNGSMLLEPGQYPNLSLALEITDGSKNSYTFRNVTLGEDGLYQARITQPYPADGEIPEDPQLVVTLAATRILIAQHLS